MNTYSFTYDKTTDEVLLDLIEKTNGVRFDTAEVTFGLPMALGETLTGLQVAASISSHLTGDTEVTYERLSLRTFFFNIPIDFRLTEAITKEYISAQFLERFKVTLNPEDFEFSVMDYGEGRAKRVDIVVNPSSYIWVGSLEGWILPPNYIGDLLGETKISFNTQTFKTNAYIYSVERTFALMTDALIASLPVSFEIYTLDLITSPLVEYLSATTGDPWVIDLVESEFNLMGSKVLFNGYIDVTQTKYAVVLELGPLCSNLEGTLIIEFDKTV